MEEAAEDEDDAAATTAEEGAAAPLLKAAAMTAEQASPVGLRAEPLPLVWAAGGGGLSQSTAGRLAFEGGVAAEEAEAST